MGEFLSTLCKGRYRNRMGEESFEDGLDWCLGEKGQPEYRCLGPSTVIVLLYAVGCVVVGFLVGFIVMQMDKRKAKKRKQCIDGDNIENKVTVKWKLFHI